MWGGAGGGLEVTVLLPRGSHTCSLWRALATEPSLSTQVLGLLLEKVSRDVPFKETRAFLLSSSPGREATLLPLAVSGAPGLPRLTPFCLLPARRGGRAAAGGGRTPQGAWAPPLGHLAANGGAGARPARSPARKGLTGAGPHGKPPVSSAGKASLARPRFQQ